MWSLGCILGEMCLKNKPDNKEGSVNLLFNGTSCFPLSPCNEQDSGTLSTGDQLAKIITIMGPLDEETVSSFTNDAI